MLCFFWENHANADPSSTSLEFRENSVELRIEDIDQVDGIMNVWIYRQIDSKCTLFFLQEMQKFPLKNKYLPAGIIGIPSKTLLVSYHIICTKTWRMLIPGLELEL